MNQSSEMDDRVAITRVLACYHAALHECDAEQFHKMWHPRGVLLGVGPDGAVVARTAEEFVAGVVSRGTSPEYAKHDKVLSIEVVDGTCASAKVQIALPPAPNSPTPTTQPVLYTDFLTLLKDASIDGGSWRIIAKTFSSASLAEGPASTTTRILPKDFLEATSAAWDLYVGAGRACDSSAMARVFHPSCNLTFATSEGIALIDCAQFCEHVGSRWQSDKHKHYAHLRGDARAAAADTLLSLDFAGPCVCRVMLRVGYPPFLYTDVLLLLKISAPLHGREGGWWIVAKSSGNVPFLSDEAQP